MTLYHCQCGEWHTNDRPACPVVIGTFDLPTISVVPPRRIRICEHCGDTPLGPDGNCPVCSQQLTEDWPWGTCPLSIARHKKMVSFKALASGGRRPPSRKCAVVAIEKRDHYDRYLTACGDVVEGPFSFATKVTCPACRRELRRMAAATGDENP